MTTTYGNAAYCVRNWPVLRCAPREQLPRRPRSLDRLLAVQLLPCNRPTGILESAPRTSLRADSAHERWEGFWSVSDEGYYTRCVRDDGSQQWYRVADEVSNESITDSRVIPFRRRKVTHDSRRTLTFDVPRTLTHDARQMLLISRPGQRPILVGVSRRGSRMRPRVGAGGPR